MSGNDSGFPKQVGLALGSGAARGWAHLGVIRALAEAGIEINFVAGTSIGSLVGAAFALGKTNELEDFARGLDWKQIVSFLDVTFPRSGLIDGKKITDFFRGQIRNINIEEMSLAYCAVATDLSTGQENVLSSGNLIDAVRASISIPGIFTPVKKDGDFLVDGGLVNPVPVSVVRNMGADFVIAVDVNADRLRGRRTRKDDSADPAAGNRADPSRAAKWGLARELANRFGDLSSPALSQVRQWMNKDPAPSIFEVLTTSISIMESRITAVRLVADPPDLLLQPQLGYIRSLEFHRAEEAIAEGYREAVARLADANPGKRY